MKNLFKLCMLTSAFWAVNIFAQQTSAPQPVLRSHSAKSHPKEYKALYVINESDENKIKGVLKNINNALEDPRLKGKLQVELLAFGAGVELFKKQNSYEPLLLNLKVKGVVMVQCENTLKEKNIPKTELFDFVTYTPSANGEMILRQYEGWAMIKP